MKRVGAAVLLLALAAAVWAWGRPTVTGLPPGGKAPPPTTAAVALLPSTTAAPTSGAAETEGPAEAAEKALAAWGRFAVSGDLSHLAPWFDPQGPQYRLLAEESARLAESPLGDPPYLVTFEPEEVITQGGEASVRGQVVFGRRGEPTQSFHWVIHLRSGVDGWRVWTVEDG